MKVKKQGFRGMEERDVDMAAVLVSDTIQGCCTYLNWIWLMQLDILERVECTW